jgi:hypothetical protein
MTALAAPAGGGKHADFFCAKMSYKVADLHVPCREYGRLSPAYCGHMPCKQRNKLSLDQDTNPSRMTCHTSAKHSIMVYSVPAKVH